VQLAARLDVELGEDFLQVVFHGASADEQPRTDLDMEPSTDRRPTA
jgi:hypothetical protein